MRLLAVPLAVVLKPPAYVPGATNTVVPGLVAALAARARVLNGAALVPAAVSEPVGET